jgi:serine/threonine protein kinase
MKYCPLCDRTYEDTIEVCATDGAVLRVPRSKQDALIDKVIKGRYRVLKKLGEGGMGAVYLADQFAINRKVALKILHADFAKDEDFVRRFRQEATLAASFSHQNVITVFDFDQADDGSLYIVMEYIDGHNLSDVIRNEPMDLATALQLAIQIAGGLSAAHRAGVIHRDIKPENIMVVGGGKEVKLMDFGIARLREPSTTTRLTQTGMIMGTPAYMAPEQIEGGELSERTDIYAFGIVLYEMLTGRVPFKATTPGAILVKHLHEAPIPLSKVRKEIPSSVERIVIQALQKSPEKRQKSMDEVVDALKKAQRDAEQLGIGGIHSFVPQMAAVRQGFNAVAISFRKLLGRSPADSDLLRSADRTDSNHYQSATGKHNGEPEPSHGWTTPDRAEAAPIPSVLEPPNVTRVEHTAVADQLPKVEAELDRMPTPPEQHSTGPGEMEEVSLAPAAESIAETAAFTLPLQVPESIPEAPEILVHAPEVAHEALFESEASRTLPEPVGTNIADLSASPPIADSLVSNEHAHTEVEILSPPMQSEYQATVAGSMTEISAAPSSETISETAIVTQRSETAISNKKSWLVAAAMGVLVIVVGLIGGLKLFRDSTTAPVVKVDDPAAKETVALPAPTESQGAELEKSAALPSTSTFPPTVVLPEITAKGAISSPDRPARKSENLIPQQSNKSSGSTTIGATKRPDSSVTKPGEFNEHGKVSKPAPEHKPPFETVREPNIPIKGPSAPAPDSHVASLKPPETLTPRIELKNLLIITSKRELRVKERIMLTVKGRYSDGKETDVTTGVQWRSSDASVASVNSRGEIEAFKEGKAQITATYEGMASPGLVLNVRANEENQKAGESGEQIKDLRRRLLR